MWLSKRSALPQQSSCSRLPPCTAKQPPHSTTVTRAAAAGSDSSKPSHHGWHWPFHRSSAADAADEETEIVFVTDTDEADEVIEELEYPVEASSSQAGQPQQQLDGSNGAELASPPRPAEQPGVSPHAQLEELEEQQLDNDMQVVPQAAAAAAANLQHHHYQQQQHQESIAAPPRPAFASSSLSVPASGSYWATSAGGWVVALSLLIAVRQGRAQADAARLDVRALQARQHDSRVQSRELKEARALYLQQQQLLKEEAAAKKLAEQAREAERARRKAAVKAAQYEKTAKEELDIFRANRAAAKKAFEESQGKLEEELAVRTAKEIALREEAEAKKAAEEAERRAAAAAEAARAAAEAAAAAAAAERALQEAAAARAAMKQQLRDASYKSLLRLQGTAIAAPVTPAGGRQLSVALSVLPDTDSSSSADSTAAAAAAPVAQAKRVYDSPDAATEGAVALAVQVAEQVYQHYAPAVIEGAALQLQGLSVQPPTSGSGSSSQAAAGDLGVQLSAADNMLWRLLLLARLEAAGRLAIGQVAPLAASGALQQDLKAQAAYSALPQSDPNCLQQRLQQCADLVSQQQLPAAIQLLDDIITWQLEDFVAADLSSINSSSTSSSSDVPRLLQQLVSGGAAAGCPASPYVVPACVYAVLLNLYDPATQALIRRSAATSSGAESTAPSRPGSPDATATAEDDDMFDAAADDDAAAAAAAAAAISSRRSIVSDKDSPLQRLVKFQLEQLEKAAPADELAPVAVCLRQLLGRRHPVAAAMLLLAERNMSAGARQARALRQQQRQLAMATELLQGSPIAGPGGGLDPQGARLRQQTVPAPERIWALRNVANSMLRSTASSGGGGSTGSGSASSSSSTPSAEEAVSMLQKASDLAAEHYGTNSPGRLSALLDCVGALLAVPGHQQEAKAAIEAVCGIVAAVGERYRQQRDLLSLVLLYESTQAELDVPEVIGRECVAMTRLQRQAADGFGVLETAQANMVMSKRKLPPGSSRTALRQLARECTEQLGGSVAVKKRDTLLDQWNKGLPLSPLR